jgi:esterase/lipase superfamily enzyme
MDCDSFHCKYKSYRKVRSCFLARGNVFNSEVNVQYLFQKSYKKTSNLIIIFSGIPSAGKSPSYNYVRTLQGYDCNKLFILDDFGCRASYYLCQGKDFKIERSVKALIDYIVDEYGIKNILSCGSSKGGYAALYYGIKYGFSHIIAASPQYFLGDYLLKQTNAQDISTFMAGDISQDREYLNGLMSEMIKTSHNKPKILLHVGDKEMHYDYHVKPLMKLLDEKEIFYELDLGDYSKHDDVAIYFPPMLKKNVSSIFGYPTINSLKFLDPSFNKLNSEQTIIVETDNDNNYSFAWYLYHQNEKIGMQNYSSDNTFKIIFKEPGEYSIAVFVMNSKGLKVSTRTEPIIIN